MRFVLKEFGFTLQMERATENFAWAVLRLQEVCALDSSDWVHQLAIIKMFELSYETGWKAIRARLLDLGEDVAGPRPVIAAGMRYQLMGSAEESIWLEMPKDRNLSTHVYNQEIAADLVPRIIGNYLPALEQLKEVLETSSDSGNDEASDRP